MLEKRIKKVLMIGLSVSILNKFRKRDDIEIYVLEEEEICKKNKLFEYKNPVLKRLIIAKYLESDEFIPIAEKLNDEIKFDGVIPARDYTVRATSQIAEVLGLPGIGAENGKILTNKCLLRLACEKYNIPHPIFKKVNSIDDIYEFYNGKPLIFKPATLQASIGISKISRKSDIEEAWKRTTNAQELSTNTVSRKLNREHILEEYIGGQEYSMETFVKDGKVIFNNITKKITFDKTFVEIGHIVPADLKNDIKDKLIREKGNLVEKLGIKYALLHSEWKVYNEQPYLIECAARVPGDYIFELIEQAYGFKFIDTFLGILSNYDFKINEKSSKVSSIRFLNAEPGVLKEIEGMESLLQPEVADWSIDKKIGDKIGKINSSWDRAGYFIVTADDYQRVEEISQNILNSIKFIVE
jgi:biotin carboxylase